MNGSAGLNIIVCIFMFWYGPYNRSAMWPSGWSVLPFFKNTYNIIFTILNNSEMTTMVKGVYSLNRSDKVSQWLD